MLMSSFMYRHQAHIMLNENTIHTRKIKKKKRLKKIAEEFLYMCGVAFLRHTFLAPYPTSKEVIGKLHFLSLYYESNMFTSK